MRTKGLTRLLLACLGLVASSLAAAQGVRFSELHYDDIGVDDGERIEVAGPAGRDLSGWRVVLYNGATGLVYNTQTLSGVLPATCVDRGVQVITYPVNGIQNGDPDGIALVDAGGTVVEFFSYEGVFAAVDGPAAGLVSSDIGVHEDNAITGAGLSLQRRPNGTWAPSAANTFGLCNDRDENAPAEVVSVSVSPASASLTVGGTVTLGATGLNSGGQPTATTFTWSSSNIEVATVDTLGLVTAIGGGDSIISARATNGVEGTANVHVNAGPPISGSPVRFNEIHYDNLGTDTGEALEVEGPAGTDVTGYSIVLYNGNGGGTYGTVSLSGTLPSSCDSRGVLAVSFPQDGLQNGSPDPDGMALFDNTGALVEFRSYEGTFTASNGPAATMTSVDIGAAEINVPPGLSLQRNSNGVWVAAISTFGACNAEEPTNTDSHLVITGRTTSDVPLPVGFQDQLFAREVDFNNQTVPSTFVWSSETPVIASIEPNGVFTALSEGSAILRATAEDGTTSTITLPTHVAVAGTTAQYGGNAEFGEPTDADPSDDYIVRYPQYTASYNPNRGTPNWVAYDLDATHFGPEDRCDCFTMDPALPANFTQLTTADYTDAGAFHGYGIDRGHLVRSFDRTTGSLDNAYTYLFDNIVPQAADLNQGPWAAFENFLGDEARNDDREVYIIAGVAGDKGTLKDQGRVVIPASTWKVAVILPRDRGLSSVRDYRDLEVIAVDMPNEPGVRNVDWHTYLTTVDALESLTGYDLLALLPDDVEGAVESNTQPPLAAISGPAELEEGDTGTFSAAGSVDPNGSIVSFAWNFGDGSTGTGESASHVFAQDGVYTVTVTITDNDGLSGTATLGVTVENVAPDLGDFDDATLEAGDAYTVEGTFADPGADAWTATVDWGDGSSPSQAMLTGHAFSLVHVYAAAGTFPVTVTISDGDTETSTVHSVTVTPPPPPPGPDLSQAFPLIEQLVANRKISRDFGRLLNGQVTDAQNYIRQGKDTSASSVLRIVVLELDLLVRFRQVTVADVAPLRTLLTQVMTQLNAPPTAHATWKYLALKKHRSCRSHQRPRIHAHQSFNNHRFR